MGDAKIQSAQEVGLPARWVKRHWPDTQQLHVGNRPRISLFHKTNSFATAIRLKLVITVRLLCDDNENDDDTRGVGQKCHVLKGKLDFLNWLRIFTTREFSRYGLGRNRLFLFQNWYTRFTMDGPHAGTRSDKVEHSS